jgi:hypothetical protein
MTIKLSGLKVDLSNEEQGEWKPSADLPGVEFLVSSLQTPAYQIARDLLIQKWTRKFHRQPVPADVRHDELGKLIAKHILHGWRGFDEDYSPETAEAMLRDRSYRALLSAVENCAAEVGDADIEYIEDAAKNSDAPSVLA